MKFIITLILFVLCQGILMAEIKYIGSSTIGKNILPEAAKSFTKQTGIPFEEIQNPGSGKGVKALIAGETPLAGISRKPENAEKKAGLKFYTIGYDGVFVIVNSTNPVNNLSLNEVKDIFTGKITNWKEVGGNDESILPVTEILTEKRATQIVFTEIVMGTDKLIGTYGKNIKQVDQPLDEAEEVAANKNAIAAVSLAFVTKKVKPLMIEGVKPMKANILDGLYLISRPLVLVTNKNPNSEVLKFIDFMYSDAGQEIVNKHFIGLK